MIETPHTTDGRLGIPVFASTPRRAPHYRRVAHIDTMVVDLQDVGTRVTPRMTTALALEACAAAGKSVVVLDRRSSGWMVVEGNVDPSGVRVVRGAVPVPMAQCPDARRDGALVKERLRTGSPRCDLTVIPMDGWRRRMRFADTAPLGAPSPNMPTPDTAAVYPAGPCSRARNVSEGGARPGRCEVWGAPYLDAAALRARFEKRKLPGCVLRDHDVEPTFHKWHGESAGDSRFT